jgi:hypothetical protein
MVRRSVRLIATSALSAIVVVAVAWAVLAVWFDGPQRKQEAGPFYQTFVHIYGGTVYDLRVPPLGKPWPRVKVDLFTLRRAIS